MVLSISGESAEPAPVHEGSMGSNHVAVLSPYQTYPNATLDAESEKESMIMVS